jgi:hypothetical protein
MSVPDSFVNAFVPANAVSGADPSEAILYMAQLDKAMSEIKDDNMKALAADELQFFKMATAVISKSITVGSGDANREYYDAIRVNFGTGIEAVKKLAAAYRELAMKRRAEEIIAKVSEATITDNSGRASGKKVSALLESKSPFHYSE